jgi:hypothetical protein
VASVRFNTRKFDNFVLIETEALEFGRMSKRRTNTSSFWFPHRTDSLSSRCKYTDEGRSQWSRGLRHEISSTSRTLASCVRTVLKAWMSVCVYSVSVLGSGPPLWSSGHSSWLHIQRSGVRFLALPDFLRSRKPRLTAVGIRCADYVTPSIRKVGTNFADKRRSLGRYSSLAD